MVTRFITVLGAYLANNQIIFILDKYIQHWYTDQLFNVHLTFTLTNCWRKSIISDQQKCTWSIYIMGVFFFTTCLLNQKRAVIQDEQNRNILSETGMAVNWGNVSPKPRGGVSSFWFLLEEKEQSTLFYLCGPPAQLSFSLPFFPLWYTSFTAHRWDSSLFRYCVYWMWSWFSSPENPPYLLHPTIMVSQYIFTLCDIWWFAGLSASFCPPDHFSTWYHQHWNLNLLKTPNLWCVSFPTGHFCLTNTACKSDSVCYMNYQSLCVFKKMLVCMCVACRG